MDVRTVVLDETRPADRPIRVRVVDVDVSLGSMILLGLKATVAGAVLAFLWGGLGAIVFLALEVGVEIVRLGQH